MQNAIVRGQEDFQKTLISKDKKWGQILKNTKSWCEN